MQKIFVVVVVLLLQVAAVVPHANFHDSHRPSVGVLYIRAVIENNVKSVL